MTEETKTILVVEDEPDMVRGLRDALSFEGYAVCSAATGSEGIALARDVNPHLVLLDLMLPDINGFAVCEELRKVRPQLPIIMLTARGQEADKIRGFAVGADDYVTKPFSLGELLARINALFRRVERTGGATAEPVRVGQGLVDLRKHTVTVRGEEHPLGVYEVHLLKFLLDRLEQAVSRDEILEQVWGVEANPTNRTVDNFVVKLRRKLEIDPKNPKHILTVYGHGYKLVL